MSDLITLLLIGLALQIQIHHPSKIILKIQILKMIQRGILTLLTVILELLTIMGHTRMILPILVQEQDLLSYLLQMIVLVQLLQPM